MVNDKKPTTKKPTMLAKMKTFLKDGADWDTKHFGVSDIVKIQVLPENKSNPKRLALFFTFQGRKGRKGLRVASTESYIEFAESVSHDKTLEIAKNLDKVNPKTSEVSYSDSEL